MPDEGSEGDGTNMQDNLGPSPPSFAQVCRNYSYQINLFLLNPLTVESQFLEPLIFQTS